MHYYDFNIADYRKDTVHLKPIEHYIYRTLMDWYYLDQAPIPLDLAEVLRKLKLEEHNVSELKNVLKDFFLEKKDGYHQRRIDAQIKKYKQTCETNKENGKRGGRPKKTESVNFANRDESEKNPNQEPITNNHKPLTINQEPKKKKKTADAVVRPESVSENVWNDFLAVRESKRMKLTHTALEQIEREAEKAGWGLDQALTECCLRGWAGFKASWVQRDQNAEATQRGGGMNRYANALLPVSAEEIAAYEENMARRKG